jgi:hypothetical protein
MRDTTSQPGMRHTAPGGVTAPLCTECHSMSEPGETSKDGFRASDSFKSGDVRTRIGQHVMTTQEWLQVLRPSVRVQLQALADEFVGNVGAEVASVCELDL